MFGGRTCNTHLNHGLVNRGNTCFINACLQCIWRIKEIWSVLDSGFTPPNPRSPKAQILWELNNLRTGVYTASTPIQPDRFLACLRHVASELGMKEFLLGQQCDAHEFLVFLIDVLDNTMLTPVNMAITGEEKNPLDIMAKNCYKTFYKQYNGKYSIVAELLTSIHVSALYEPGTPKIIKSTITSQVHNVLSLQLPQKSTAECNITECLDKYCAIERLEEENAWYDEQANVYKAVDKKTVFWSLPNVLIILINRWTVTGAKDPMKVVFPTVNLDMSPYVIGYHKSSYVYNLFAVCYHFGNVGFGHYTASCLCQQGIWVYYDDDRVVKIDPSNVVNKDAYILFYHKK